jgi:hypothetical protein
MGRDFHRQNNLNPWRCHAVKVSGRTETKVSFQSKNSLAANTIVSRVIGGPSRSNLTFLVEGQLFAQEEILSRRGAFRLEETAQISD